MQMERNPRILSLQGKRDIFNAIINSHHGLPEQTSSSPLETFFFHSGEILHLLLHLNNPKLHTVSGERSGTPDRGLWLAHHAVIFFSLPCVVYIIPSTVFSCIMGAKRTRIYQGSCSPPQTGQKESQFSACTKHNKKEASIDDKKSGEKKKKTVSPNTSLQNAT